MRNITSYIIQYVLYFKALFWALLALMQFIFPMGDSVFQIHSFLFLLNGIVFFCIGFAFSRANKEVFRGAVAFLVANILLVLIDGFGAMDAISIILDMGVLMAMKYQMFHIKKPEVVVHLSK